VLVENFAPSRLLKLGYAVARGQSGAVIRSTSECSAGERITIEVADGHLVAQVIESYGKE
jgi:exonuclease VII large subunit